MAGQQRGLSVLAVSLQQLGDAKVQQLDLSVVANQHIGGFEIAVHNQIGVSMGYSVGDVEKEAEARLHAEPLLITIAVDVVPLNML